MLHPSLASVVQTSPSGPCLCQWLERRPPGFLSGGLGAGSSLPPCCSLRLPHCFLGHFSPARSSTRGLPLPHAIARIHARDVQLPFAGLALPYGSSVARRPPLLCPPSVSMFGPALPYWQWDSPWLRSLFLASFSSRGTWPWGKAFYAWPFASTGPSGIL